jgi:hypothetical protein
MQLVDGAKVGIDTFREGFLTLVWEHKKESTVTQFMRWKTIVLKNCKDTCNSKMSSTAGILPTAELSTKAKTAGTPCNRSYAD